MPAPPARDDGYALVAAVAALAVFSLVAFQVLAEGQGDVAQARAEAERARLNAAADAGLALAVHGLAEDVTAARWEIDGRVRELGFDGEALEIRVEDERGKVDLNGLNDAQAHALFSGAGVEGDRLEALVGELRRWKLGEDQAPGSPSPDAKPGFAPRHAHLSTVGELGALKDMDAGLYARLAPVSTTFAERSGGFEAANASPLAIETMRAVAGLAGGDGTPQPPPDIEGQKPTETIEDESLQGRTLTVRVLARDAAGARAERSAIVELTGDKARPYWVRFAE